MNKSMVAASALFAAFALSTSANALEFNPYVGAAYNFTDANAKGFRPDYNSGTFFIGSDYNKYFSTEFHYQYSDKDKKGFNPAYKLKTNFNSYGLDAYGRLPLFCDQRFALLGTVGIAQYNVTKKYTDEKSQKDNGWGYRAGLGAEYDLDQNWTLRGIARYVELDKIDQVDHMLEYTLGIKYRF